VGPRRRGELGAATLEAASGVYTVNYGRALTCSLDYPGYAASQLDPTQPRFERTVCQSLEIISTHSTAAGIATQTHKGATPLTQACQSACLQ
jgi:hypothetical protein